MTIEETIEMLEMIANGDKFKIGYGMVKIMNEIGEEKLISIILPFLEKCQEAEKYQREGRNE